MFPVSFDSSATRLPQNNDPFSPTASHAGTQSHLTAAIGNPAPNMFGGSVGTNVNGPSAGHSTSAAFPEQLGGYHLQQQRPSSSAAPMPYNQAFEKFANASSTMHQQPAIFNAAGFGGSVQTTMPFQPDWSAFSSLSAAQQQQQTSNQLPESFFGHLALPSALLHGAIPAPAASGFSSDPFAQNPATSEQTAPHHVFPFSHGLQQPGAGVNVPQRQQQQSGSVLSAPAQLDIENDAALKALRDELELIDREVNALQEQYTRTQQEVLEKEQAVMRRNQDVAATQSEVSSLKATMKQLDMQKELAHRKLLELESEKSQLEQSVKVIRDELTAEEADVKQLRLHVDENSKSLKNQEAEYNRKREELAELTAQENLLHQKLESSRIQLANLDGTLQDGTSKLAELEEQVARARSLNTSLEEAVRRFDAAMGKLDAADEKHQTDSSGDKTGFPQLDELTEADLKLSAERFSFSAAGLGVGKFELIDPFQNLSFETPANTSQHIFTGANGRAKSSIHKITAEHDAFNTDPSRSGFGSNSNPAAFSAEADPFVASSTNNSSQSNAAGGWAAFSNNNNSASTKSPPPRPPPMTRVIAQTTGPAGFWSSEFDPFGSSNDATASNNNDNSQTYFRGGGNNLAATTSSAAAFMPASRTGPYADNKAPGNSGGFDAWDAFAPSPTADSRQSHAVARPSSRNTGGFPEWGS